MSRIAPCLWFDGEAEEAAGRAARAASTSIQTPAMKMGGENAEITTVRPGGREPALSEGRG